MSDHEHVPWPPTVIDGKLVTRPPDVEPAVYDTFPPPDRSWLTREDLTMGSRGLTIFLWTLIGFEAVCVAVILLAFVMGALTS